MKSLSKMISVKGPSCVLKIKKKLILCGKTLNQICVLKKWTARNHLASMFLRLQAAYFFLQWKMTLANASLQFDWPRVFAKLAEWAFESSSGKIRNPSCWTLMCGIWKSRLLIIILLKNFSVRLFVEKDRPGQRNCELGKWWLLTAYRKWILAWPEQKC